MRAHDPATKAKAILRYIAGEPITKITQDLGIRHRTLYNWLDQTHTPRRRPEQPPTPKAQHP